MFKSNIGSLDWDASWLTKAVKAFDWARTAWAKGSLEEDGSAADFTSSNSPSSAGFTQGDPNRPRDAGTPVRGGVPIC